MLNRHSRMASPKSTAVPVFFLVSAILPLASGHYWVDERSIRDTILNSSNYDPTIRPYSPVEIYGRFVIFALNNLDIAGQEMSATGVLYTTWSDNRLMWDPSLYGGITTITVVHGSIWIPPLIVENSATEMEYVGSDEKVHQRIYADGTVKWMIPLVSHTTCEMKILKFPFDSQHCGMTLYTWAHDVKEMYIIHPEPVLTEYYSQNGEWDYTGSSTTRDMVTDGTEIFSKLTIKIHFRRKWLFLGLSLIIPAVLNSLLMCAVFALSFESGEKLGYALTVLLTYIVLLTLVADSLPPISTDISVLQIYLTGVMCLGTIATLLTVLTVSVYNQKPEKPRPKWLLSLCCYILAPLACRTYWWRACKKCGSQTTRERRPPSRPKVHPMEMSTLTDLPFTNGAPPTNTHALMFNRGRAHSMLSQNGLRAPQRPTSMLLPKDQSYANRVDTSGFKSRPQTPENLRLQETLSRENTEQPPQYSDNERKDADSEGDSKNSEVEYSWQEVAEFMDSAFLRIISFVIGAGTVALLIFFIVVY